MKYTLLWPAFPAAPVDLRIVGLTWTSEDGAKRFASKLYRRPWFWLRLLGWRVVRFG